MHNRNLSVLTCAILFLSGIGEVHGAAVSPQLASAPDPSTRDTPGEQNVLLLPARFSANDVTLEAALTGLSQTSGVAIAFSPTLVRSTTAVSCACSEVTLEQALRTLLSETSFAFMAAGQLVIVRPRSESVEERRAPPLRPNPEKLRSFTLASTNSSRGNFVGRITGRVTDAGTGQAVAGAQVHIPGTSLGAISGATGRFALANVPAGTHELRVDLLGYRTITRQIVIRDDETLEVNFEVHQEALALEQLVVTGTAGRTERKAQGAVIASVSAQDVVDKAPVSSVGDLLQGRVAGVSMTGGSGASGTGQQLRIRGVASISISNEPLLYIDGLRADSRLGTGDVSRLNDLDPSQIESIEIVKGPAAATLYGADASAGVIQVITKKGAAGAGFKHSIETQVHSLEPRFTSWLNYGRCTATQISNPESTLCQGTTPGTVVIDDPLARYDVLRNGSVRSLAWNMRGGGQGYRAFTSLSIHDENGTLPNNEHTRTSGRVNFSFFPVPNLEIGTNIGVMRVKTALPTAGGSGFGYTIAMFAGSPLTVGGPQNGLRHPYLDFDAIAAIETSQTITRVIPDLNIKFSPTSWFTNRLILGADASQGESVIFYPRNDVGYYQRGRDAGEITETRNNFSRFTANYLATFKKDHRENLSSMLSLGAELLAETDDRTFAYGLGLTTNSARAVSSAAVVSGGQTRSDDRRVGIFAQWEPSYADRLFLQFGARADKFSAFGTDVDWFLSPSARLSYVLTEEPTIREKLPEAISSLRWRGAFGTTGRAPTSGASLTTYSPAPFVLDNGSVGSGVVPLNPGNPLLKAEKGQEIETGFDVGLLNNRVAVEYSFFRKTTKDLILQVPQPPSLGFNALPFENIGKVRNSGHELTLKMDLVNRQRFGLEVALGVNTLNNEVLDLGGTAPFSSIRFEGTNRVAQGFPVGGFFTHRIKQVDVAANRVVVSDTLEFLGNLLPGLEGNLSTTVRLLKRLRLYTHFDTKQDVMIYNTTAAFRDHSYGNSEYAARRSEMPPEQIMRRFGPFYDSQGRVVNRALVNEVYIENASFVRLNEVSLTYELPPRFVPGNGQRASIQLGGRNLAVWTNFSGLDPDVQNEFDAVAGRADFGSFPSGRRWTARILVDF